MTHQTVESLHASFSIEDQLSIINGVESEDSFPFITIKNKHASAIISVYGAHVLSYKPLTESTEKDLLFVSPKAIYKHGKAIRGGIPLCWPWFGKDPESTDQIPSRGMHGFARNQMWSLVETESTEDGETIVSLALTDNKKTREVWPHTFKLTLKVTIGKTLKLELTSQNMGDKNVVITQALHTYFSVSDVTKIRAEGLDNIDYLDATIDNWPTKKQLGDIRFGQRTDRIYTDAPSEVNLVDEDLQRQILITSTNSNSSVVWNPWEKISKDMIDLEDDAYKYFVCIETSNAASDSIEVKPNDSFCLTAEYTLSKVV